MAADVRSWRDPVSGLWVPQRALEAKADRSQSGAFSMAAGDNGRILQGAPSAESRFKDYQSYLEAVKTVPWVFACVSLLAYSFATAPGDLFDGNDEPVDDPNDPFLQAWHRPNPHQSGMVFKELLAMFVELAGEAYISLESPDSNGIPSELYLPSPARMRVVQDNRTGEIIGYAYDTSGYQNGRYLPSFIPYGVDEIVHIKVANPLNMLHGLGNIEAMEVTMDTMVAMSQNELNYWKSGGRITGVLETEQQLDTDTFERLVNRWRMFSADKQARFKTAILEQGLKYTPVAEGFKGLDYTKLDVAKRDFVLANFGVPKNKLGIIEDAQYKSDEADRFFWSETMDPRLSRAEDHFNFGYPRSLVEIFHPEGDYYYKYERKNYEDDTVKLNNAMMMRSLKAFTQNEIRRYINVPDLPGKAGESVILQQTDVVVELDKMDEAQDAGVAGAGPPPTKPPDDPSVLKARAPKPPEQGAPHAGGVPQAGVPAIVAGNQTTRQSGVDDSGHTPSTTTANANPGPKPPEKAWSPEVYAALSEEEKSALIMDYDRQLKAASVVARSFRQRGRETRIRAKGMGRVVEYREKQNAKFETKEIHSVPSHRPAIAAHTITNARRTRGASAVTFAPKLREAASTVRRSMTPVISKALKITDKGDRDAYLKLHLSFAPINAAVREIHADAANQGWAVGKRSLGFSARPSTRKVSRVETKDEGDVLPDEVIYEDFTSPFLSDRYDRALAPNAQDISDRMMGDVQDRIDLGLERAYSPYQIANGVPDEGYDGLTSIFDDGYDAERIARTESMYAFNWGAGSALLDSGVQEEEALDGIDDPDCAERNGTVYAIDPDTGLAVDDSGVPVRDHPNGTLAFIPSGDFADLVASGALDVQEVDYSDLGAEWEGKEIGAEQAGSYHKHRNGIIHAHDSGLDSHGHRWSKEKIVVGAKPTVHSTAPKEAEDAETKLLAETIRNATKTIAKLIEGK